MNASVVYTPIISLITPVFNREQSLSRCIRSVLSQSYEHYEHIIVDDGSSDSSREVVKEYQKECGRLILVDLPSNKGVNFARNRGIENARGDLLMQFGILGTGIFIYLIVLSVRRHLRINRQIEFQFSHFSLSATAMIIIISLTQVSHGGFTNIYGIVPLVLVLALSEACGSTRDGLTAQFRPRVRYSR